jgi:hypothetical protein
MSRERTLGVLAGVILMVVSPAVAKVFCAKKSGVVAVRDTCKKKETQLDLANFGAVGPTGPAGTALAYAKVNPDGTVDPDQSKNITSANVTLRFTSAYCFHDLSFSPTSVVATIAYGETNNQSFGGEIAQAEIHAPATTDCNDGETAEVATAEYSGSPLAFTFAPAAFYVIFN